MKIGLDAGHGINTAGKRTPDGIHEWTLNDKVRDCIIEELKPYNCEIICSDDYDDGQTDVGLTQRRNAMINNKVDVYVSLHHNALKGEWGNHTGVEVYVDRNCTADDRKLAELVNNRLSQYTGLKNRGIKEANFAVINQNKIPAILVEGGFMDSNIDYKVITSEEGQKAYARAVAEALIEFLGLGKGQATVVEDNTNSATNENSNIFNDRKINCIYDIQEYLNNKYGFNLALDNRYGKDTHEKLVKALQTELNKQFNAGLVVDGKFGPKTKNACINVKQGASGNIVMLIQMALFIKGYNLAMDKMFGPDMKSKIEQCQKDNGLSADGVVGKNTFELLFI